MTTRCRPALQEPVGPRSGLVQRMDYLRMTKSDRRIAEESLRNGELIADFIHRAGASLRHFAALISKCFAYRADGNRDPAGRNRHGRLDLS